MTDRPAFRVSSRARTWRPRSCGRASTALIGGPYDDINRGAVWVFKLHGSDFVQQGTPRRHPGRGFLRFGRSVAVSQNGRVVIAGTPTHSHNAGAVAVFGP